MCVLCSSVDVRKSQSVLHYWQLCNFVGSAEGYFALTFEKICLPKSKWCSKSKVKVNVLN
jgi:hypothetical protein